MSSTKAESLQVKFSYLDRQFADVDSYLDDIRALAKSGEFTLGSALADFESRFAEICRIPNAVGVASGTDALILSLKALGIGSGDEVITTPMTFIATVGAIVMTGARPVFVDSEDGFVIDASRVEAAVTPRTKAIIPVHYTGNVADMPQITAVARRHGLLVVEDACQALSASLDGQPVGSWGQAACFSLHPLKNLNVWGDGGMIVCGSAALAEKLRLYRNHGLLNRDEVALFGCNSRLDSLQAVVGNRLIRQVEWITEQRIASARRYDEALRELGEFISIPRRRPGVKHVYHLYMVRAQRRDQLFQYLKENGVEAKIHYPVPVHLQAAARPFGYHEGDFPVCERDSRTVISLPCHQHLTGDEIDYVCEKVRSFYLS
jgi:dTDP-4-amino-4,6-dideoxygalactose transaminase